MKKQTRNKSLTLFLSISLMLIIGGTMLVGACGGGGTTATGPIKLVFSTHESNTGIYYEKFWKPWMDEVSKRTNGKVTIEGHFNGELAAPPDAWDVLINGTVDISNVHLQNVPGKFPMCDIVCFTTYDLVNQRPGYVLNQLYNKFPEMQDEFKDCHLLMLASTYWTSYAGSKKVQTLNDMKGMKVVGVGTWQNKRAEAMGMVPVSMGPADILPALQKKVVEGGDLGTLLILLDFGWGEFLPYVTHVRQENISLIIGMNNDKWNSLPKDVQKTLDGMKDWVVDLHDKMWVDAEHELMPQLIEKYKMDFYTPPADELAKWTALDKPVEDAFVADLNSKGLPGTKLMSEYLALEKQSSINLNDWKQ